MKGNRAGLQLCRAPALFSLLCVAALLSSHVVASSPSGEATDPAFAPATNSATTDLTTLETDPGGDDPLAIVESLPAIVVPVGAFITAQSPLVGHSSVRSLLGVAPKNSPPKDS